MSQWDTYKCSADRQQVGQYKQRINHVNKQALACKALKKKKNHCCARDKQITDTRHSCMHDKQIQASRQPYFLECTQFSIPPTTVHESCSRGCQPTRFHLFQQKWWCFIYLKFDFEIQSSSLTQILWGQFMRNWSRSDSYPRPQLPEACFQ